MQDNIQVRMPRLSMRELLSTFVVGIITMVVAGIWAQESGNIGTLKDYVNKLNFLGLYDFAWSAILVILAFPLGFLVNVFSYLTLDVAKDFIEKILYKNNIFILLKPEQEFIRKISENSNPDRLEYEKIKGIFEFSKSYYLLYLQHAHHITERINGLSIMIRCLSFLSMAIVLLSLKKWNFYIFLISIALFLVFIFAWLAAYSYYRRTVLRLTYADIFTNDFEQENTRHYKALEILKRMTSENVRDQTGEKSAARKS